MKSRIKWYFLRKRTLFSCRISEHFDSLEPELANCKMLDSIKCDQQKWNRATRWIDCDGRSVWRGNALHWLSGDALETKKSVRQLRDAPFVRAACSRLQGEPEIFELSGGKASAQVPCVQVVLRFFFFSHKAVYDITTPSGHARVIH